MKTSLSLVAMALALSGCAQLWTRAGGSVSVPVKPAPLSVRPASLAQAICPPVGAAYLVRDLTRPWSRRRYLLPEGGFCTPQRSVQ